jgi:thioesterase domain-containing protein
MVPRHFMILQEIPLSSNGKVDRGKLPKIVNDILTSVVTSSSIVSDELFCEPATDLENDVLECFMEILKLKATDICCVRDSFFQLGGNSVSAIQLIFRILKTTNENVSVQDLFSAPTVQGICLKILGKRKNTVESDAIKGGGYEIICLQKGASGLSPLLLFNPAGASGLCYSDLVKRLDDSIPVYCVDDGGILNALSENGCHAKSIEEVCQQIQPLVLEFSLRYGKNVKKWPVIRMGGWSYGGVIAVKMAELFVSSQQEVDVDSLFLFDCPLRASRSVASLGSDIDDLKPSSDMVDIHFEYCTGLLKKFYSEQEKLFLESKLIPCDVLDLRAEESTYDCGGDLKASLNAFCSGAGQNHYYITPGTHWSMLFGDNAKSVAHILHRYMMINNE